MTIEKIRKDYELIDLFCNLAEVPSPSMHEDKVAEWIKNYCDKNEISCKLDDFGNAVIKNLTEDECHLTTYMVPAYKQYIDDERKGDAKLLISFSIYEDEATISFHWNVPKD